MTKTRIENFYNNNYKKLLIVPLILLIFAISTLTIQQTTTGSFVNRDVTLQGGISATIYSTQEIDKESLELALIGSFPNSDISLRELASFTDKERTGIIIEATELTNEELKPFLEETLNIELTRDIYSIQEIGSALGESFYREMLMAIAFAFLLMASVVFIIFRKLIPSLAVVLSAILDLGVTLAIVSLLGLKLSSAGIAAFLMVIGYSIDTDILLTTRVLKRKLGTSFERTYGAFKTGITMTLTTLTALTTAFLITNSPVLKQMFGIIIIALMVDIIATWCMNAPILTWYTNKNGNK